MGDNRQRANKITFVTFFPLCENIHLSKDAGMIPYVLYRDYGYDSYLVSYKNGDYPYMKTEVPGLKLLFIEPNNGLFRKLVTHSVMLYTVLDVFPFILKNGKKIDVLELYYMCMQSIIISIIYKLVNRKGCVFLKLDYGFPETDISKEVPQEGFIKRTKYFFYRKLLRSIFDIIALETWSSYEYIKGYHPRLKWISDRMYHIPNGIDVNELSSLTKFYNEFYNDEKENRILHIGRIGSYQKATEIVLEVFSRVARSFSNWRLILVGIMDKKFMKYFNDFMEINKDIRERISYIGFVHSREEVYENYWKSKIIAFPSRYETFSMVPVEAGYFGDVILGSNIPCIVESTDNGKLGYQCPVDDIDCFANTLKYMLSHDDELKVKSKAFRQFIIENYNWNKICGYLNDIILRVLDTK